MSLRTIAKKQLSKVIPNVRGLRYLAQLPELERWRREKADSCVLVPRREDVYGIVHGQCGNEAITYLEFGVFRGESLRHWTQLNRHPDSRFVGFDTFTGLPEAWEGFGQVGAKGLFSVDGQLPKIDDSRVEFRKGLFQETLPGFVSGHSASGRVIVNNDSDLYSSTLYVLTSRNAIFPRGTFIIFDEFSAILDEFLALEEWCKAYQRDYRVVAATRGPQSYFQHVAIEML